MTATRWRLRKALILSGAAEGLMRLRPPKWFSKLDVHEDPNSPHLLFSELVGSTALSARMGP
jgi:hypothetical protein